ncbi:MAG TPA: aminomethyl-transferring glycine dehydrogenase subunit GcvPA [candidate division Zixibacteria bacterium]|nr:aminomethyl-transferring glycine dehydrogenase subunit GcvPA [candidate division Zixibacteria bacterium]
MAYIPNTDDDRSRMLKKIGVDSFEQLLTGIPEHLRFKKDLNIPSLSEMELLREIAERAADNRNGLICFAGGGVYDHFIPAALPTIVNRPEYMTAYTPYQAEVAQGTLQVIYEFQSHICRLTGMEVANASMYDGATASAEALLMAARVTRRDKLVVSETVSPLFRDVIATYLSGRDMELVVVPMLDGHTDLDGLKSQVDDKTAAVLIAQPNFFGLIEEAEAVAEIAHNIGAKLVMAVDPISQALLKTPAECGADIVVGEGQPLGMPLSYGGPLLGFFAARKDLVRQVPGRIASRTKDVDGRDGFVLTLQTREQHIRREKATSNICTNQALCATTAAVYLTLMGRQGLKQVALLSAERAQETARAMFALGNFEPYFEGPFVREFAVKTPIPAKQIIQDMVESGVLPGIDAGRWYRSLPNCLIVAATEKRTAQDITCLTSGLKDVVKRHAVSRR